MNFKIPTPVVPTIEELQAKYKGTPHANNLLATTNLEAWLTRAKKAYIPAIPAIWSNPIPCREVYQALDNEPAPNLKLAQAWLEENLKENTMWRWSLCAPMEVKFQMGKGKGKVMQVPMLHIDDPRFFDILADALFASMETVKVGVRPWIEAATEANFPVEFRVFVENETATVSSYYPQRPLDPKWEAQAQLAKEYALALKTQMPDNQNFSADFLVTTQEEVLFLEGGPGWGHGAHPCCLALDRPLDGRIAWEPEPGSPEFH